MEEKKYFKNEDVNLSTTVYVFEDVRGRFCTIETFFVAFGIKYLFTFFDEREVDLIFFKLFVKFNFTKIPTNIQKTRIIFKSCWIKKGLIMWR